MDEKALLEIRLRNTGFVTPFKTAPEAVAALGAVQAQDFIAAKWALGRRVRGASDASVEADFNAGKILRTHVLRPTWHFVTPEDIRWMLALSADRVRARMAPYDKNLKLTRALYAKSNAALAKAARGGTPTRAELKQVLAGIGIKTDVQRLAHLVMDAELEGILCSGPRAGKQFTYALLDERAPKAPRLSREEALARLALTYFKSHGPAQLADFAWWSGLAPKDAAAALESIRPKLAKVEIAGKTYWHRPAKSRGGALPHALLLSIYDEYTIAYADRSALSEKRDIERMIKMGNALTAVIILNGRVAGTSKRVMKKGRPEITLSPFHKLSKTDREALDAERNRLLAYYL